VSYVTYLDDVRAGITAGYQHKVGIKPDGILGPETTKYLSECIYCGCFVISRFHTEEECILGQIARFMEE